MFIQGCSLSPTMWGLLIGCIILQMAMSLQEPQAAAMSLQEPQSAAISLHEPLFLVLFPAELSSLTNTRVCVHVLNVKEHLDLTISFTTSGESQTMWDTAKHPSYFRCFSLKVPPVGSQDGIIANLSFEARQHNHVVFQEEKLVYISSQNYGTIIQTDKPIYKLGEKVGCRIVTLDFNFIPQGVEYPLIEVEDAERNRIAQWINVMPSQGIAEIAFHLDSEAMLGEYTIHIKTSADQDIYQTFTVEKYVLPKFVVDIKAPNVVTTLDSDFSFSVCGRYTYAKPTKGFVKATVCHCCSIRWHGPGENPSEDDGCQQFSGLTDSDGCFSTVVRTAGLNMWEYVEFSISASLEESDAGVVISASTVVPVSENIVTMEFQNVESYYRAGVPYIGKIFLRKADGTPMSSQMVYLFVYSKEEMKATFTTDSNGTASFSLDTTNWTGRVELKARYLPEGNSSADEPSHDYGDAYFSVEEFYSSTTSFVQIQCTKKEHACGTKMSVWVDYDIFREELKHERSLDIFYLVISKNEIIIEGSYKVALGKDYEAQGSFPISLDVSATLAPVARVLVYAVLPSGGAMADSCDFDVAKCFNNEAILWFSKDQILPGNDLTLNLQASTSSLCAVRVVDHSVLLMKPETELTAELVYNMLPVQNKVGYPYQVAEYNGNPCLLQGKTKLLPPHFRNPYDTFGIFKRAGLKVITNCDMKKPIICSEVYRETFKGSNLPDIEPLSLISQSTSEAEKVRTYFPETWLWELHFVGAKGLNLQVTAPDTITEWKASMFCTGSSGFGLADPVSLITFKPFFMEPVLPYSIIRGESFDLKVKVFSFLEDCIMVHVHLQQSSDFDFIPCETCQYTSCLCENEDEIFFWNIIPKSLGAINFTLHAEALETTELCSGIIPIVPTSGKSDTVIKSLLVEPEGVLVEHAKSSMMCADDSSGEEDLVLQPPVDAVNDTARVEILVIGNIMGSAMENLDQLLAMPYGCGEQNMLGFSVDVSVMKYLKASGQLMDTALIKGIEFLQSGYQRQLNYKRKDCSFSAFGNSDVEGSLWLTAFTATQFAQAADFIFIDSSVIECAVQWMSQYQLENGCFKNVGQLYHTSMKGGVNDDVSLSAYICYSLLELPSTPDIDHMVSRCIQCLTSVLPNVTNPYTMALLANVFRNPTYSSYRMALLQQLDLLSIKEDGLIHWETSSSPPPIQTYWYSAPTAQVELAGYVILAYLSEQATLAPDVSYVSAIARWIVKQQGPYGGFETTQDTVVGFAALAKYAAVVRNKELHATVQITHNLQVVGSLSVNDANSLVLQRTSLRQLPGNYTVKVVGQGCVYVQAILRYNMYPTKGPDSFSIEVFVDPQDCTDNSTKSFVITIIVSYLGNRNATNMVIIDVQMPSGFSPDDVSLKQLGNQYLVKKVVGTTTSVTIYLSELAQKQPEMYMLTMKQDVAVDNLKAATISIYDYYKPEDRAVATYSAPCSSGI
ncbi:alpha-2-macroglobulin-like protein 1 [Protopterus annectens]|uniref:alpha-2-macroglobulin-like protein 1 n=1 Tax=Protopterus annectens TaxID=7888 RepID=UPI001CFC0705|nr:alpha-2-macroglobulin-like protein 1 [Protopterus annectens]XP_043917949.1 alpha-2-macroglobulin-like protein 1 [Protopterus annectens]